MIDIDQWVSRNYLWKFQFSVFTSLLHIGWSRHVFSFAKMSSSKIKQFHIDLKFLMILNKMATKSFHVLNEYYEKESLSHTHVFEWHILWNSKGWTFDMFRSSCKLCFFIDGNYFYHHSAAESSIILNDLFDFFF